MIEKLLCLGFISLYLWFCYVIFTRSILSTPACDVLLYVRRKTTTHAKKKKCVITRVITCVILCVITCVITSLIFLLEV